MGSGRTDRGPCGRVALLRVALVAAGVATCCGILLASPGRALAATTFTAVTPAADTTVPGSPAYVSVYADDTSMILGTTTMTINGTPVPVTLDYPGYWADPDCEENWVVSDWTAATVSTPSSLREGTYTVEVTVRTQSSGTSTYSWTFTIAYTPDTAATFWSRSPAPGASITAPAPLQSWVGPASGRPLGAVKFYLDGVAQTTFSVAGGGGSVYAYTPTIASSEGTHTARLEVLDNVGRYTDSIWTFNTQIKPTLSAPVPAGGLSYAGPRPQIGLTIADNTPGQLGVRLVLDGTEVYNAQTNQGAFRWTPTFDLASGVNHVATATVTDAVGNTSTLSWEFNDAVLFTSVSPSAGTTITGSPGQVSVFLDAGAEILSPARMWIDGVPVAATVDWVGHLEDPDCEAIWVVDDWTSATISAQSGLLLEGSHTVRLEADILGGGMATYEWSFAIKYAAGSQATFSSRTPAAGSTVTSYPTMRFTVASPSAVTRTNIFVYIDGTRVAHTSNVYSGTTHFVTVNPAYFTNLDGPHTVRVVVLSNAGVVTEDTWSFQTQILPTLTGEYPTVAAPAHVPRPQIGVMVDDNAPGQQHLHFRLDGVTVFDGPVDQAIFRFTPTSDFANNSTHNVVADVWDAAGNTKSLSWSFTVVALPAMSDSGSCTACHPVYPGAHPFTNCSGCHADDPLYDPHESNRYAPLGPCYDCHGSSYTHPASSVSNCVWCHTNPDWTQIPRHETSPATAHESELTECSPCHDLNLVTEHAKYPADSPFKNQCASCHVNEDSAVKTAIANHDTSCYACHGQGDPHHEEPDLSASAQPAGPQCSVCHTNLTLEHLKSTSSSAADACDACHAPGGARDSIVGAWDRTCDTDGCHSQADTARRVHTNYCFACHDVSQPDFSVAKTAFPAVDDVNRDSACKACHAPGLVGTHPYHQIGANCGTACHPGWGNSLSSATPLYTDPVSGASFATAGSKSTPAAVLHTIHANPRWPASLAFPQSACSSCHATAACTACHTGAIPSTHAEHSASDQDANPAWRGLVSYGVTGGDQTQRTAYTDSVQCASQGCHDLVDSKASAPDAVEDYNYTAGVNPDDPAGTNTAVSVAGTWRWRASNRYSGGRMSYANVAGASLSATVAGERLEIVSDMDPYRGQAEVLVDGVVVGSFDGYAPTTRYQVVVFSTDVDPGTHTVTVRPTGQRSVSARGAFVVVDAFRVYSSLPQLYVPECASCHADRTVTHW